MDIEEAKRRSRRGPRLLLARRAVLLTVTFVSTVTVARLVSPREYGLAAMSIVILAFAQLVRDFGVSNAVLRKARISEQELSLIFWFNAVSTTLVSAVLVGLAPVASAFYDEPVVESTMVVSVIGFQLGGLAMMHRALINRNLRFETVAVIDIAGAVAGFVVTVTLAFIRHDVWAIVIGNLFQTGVGAVLALLLGRWWPGRPRRDPEFRSLLRFGVNTLVYTLSVFVSRNVAVVLIGSSFGSAALGQYNRAQALFQLPGTNLIQPISQATVPLLTRVREDPPEYRAAYLRLVRQLCVFLMPLSVTLCFAGVPLTEALLGQRWHTAGVLLSALAPALFAVGVAHSVNDVFVTQDRSAELRNLGLVEVVVRVGAIAIGLSIGLVATALAFTVSTVVVALVRVVVAGRKGPLSARAQLGAGVSGLAPAAGSALTCLGATLVGPGHSALAAALVLVAGVVGAVLGGLATARSRRALVELLELFVPRLGAAGGGRLSRLLRRPRRRASRRPRR